VSPGDEAEDNDEDRGNPHGDGAEIVGPLGEVRPRRFSRVRPRRMKTEKATK